MPTRSRRKQRKRVQKTVQRGENSSLQLETLEERQLLAGLTLAGVLPTDGVLLQNGEVRNVAPQDLTLRFDQDVDPATLGAIQVIRAGGDAEFGSATVSSDFNTGGGVIIRFDSVVAGAAGNGASVIVSTADLGTGSRNPDLSVANNTVFVELNSNPAALTRAFDLRETMNLDPAVSALITTSLNGGNAFTTIGDRSVNYSPLTLTGANSARATTNFNKSGLAIEFRAVQSGPAGNGIVVNFAVNNFGGQAPPQITVNNQVVTIVVNNNPGNQTTALDLLQAVNNNPVVNQVIRASLNSGSPLTVLGDVPPPLPLTLGGANDVVITPGFVGLGTTDREVVVRFSEQLPDDTYLLSISGTGATPLMTPNGMVLNSGARDEVLEFELDLGAQVVSVVPQPITRVGGALNQERNKILVYFNDDDLDRASAETSSFYQLILSNNTVTNTDDEVFVPTSVVYNADSDMAELTFAADIDALSVNGQGGLWRLRIGTDESAPLAPSRFTPADDVGSSFNTAFDLNTVLDTGSAIIVNGDGAAFVDEQTFTITDANGVVTTFEFEDSSGTVVDGVADGNVPVPFFNTIDADGMTALISGIISSEGLAGITVTTGDATIFIDGDLGITISPTLSALSLANQGIILSGTIDNEGQPFALDLPGGNDDIGHREIPIESHLAGSADLVNGISTIFYNFQDIYGQDPLGNNLHNAITDIQKDRAREIFEIYGNFMGAQFVETPTSGLTIVTGDMRPLGELNGVGGTLGVADPVLGIAIMDLQDFDDTNDDVFGGPWFQTAFHEIGHLLGFGHTFDLPDPTIMGSDPTQNPVPAEPIFPADGDIIHGQHLFRPESKDIDLYKITVNESGVLTAETFAERLADPSLLDTTLTLYSETGGEFELVARNDDYSSEDSLLKIEVTPGDYYIGVSASGNNAYDPTVEDSGFGGVTEGAYDLRVNFQGLGASNQILDADGQATALDGDADGVAGGVYNFWFRAQDDANTYVVDKAATVAQLQANPTNLFQNIDDALAVAANNPHSIVRIVGNGGADGDIATVDDNLAYEIGFSQLNSQLSGTPLADGTSLEVPKDVTVMIDSGAIIKLRRGRIGVGSSDTIVDRSGGALQVLGVPRIVDAGGEVLRDAQGAPIPGSVYFTSIHDETLGVDTDPNFNSPDPAALDWGGIVFRRAIDAADASRVDLEKMGVFLNYVNHADIQYGGGEVVVDATSTAIAPIELQDARATISYNTIHNNANSAIAATPDTFEETNFHSNEFQLSGEFTSDYTRVGPDIDNNRIFDNSLNGLEIRVPTPAGQFAIPLNVQARFDDSTITHVLSENLQIQSTPGGPITEDAAPPVRLVTAVENAVAPGGTSLPAGEYSYRLVFVDAFGNEGPPSNATAPITIAANSAESITLGNLPAANGFSARRIYRSIDGGAFVLAQEINAFTSTFVDDGTTEGGALAEFAVETRARLDASLVIDPKVVLKISDSIIDVGVGAQLVAEGRDGEEVILTSIHDQRYGAGGTFNTNNDTTDISQPGNWGGIFAWHESTVSLEHAVVAYGGGTTRLEGGFRGFGAIEAHQTNLRLANSIVELSADGTANIEDGRFGRGDNGPAAVFVRGNEPIIVDNIFRDNVAQAISLDVNTLSGELVQDYGGSIGPAEVFTDALGNQGALIRGNLLNNNAINGVVVRGGTLTRDGVWDDTDIVHVVFDQITVPNLHTYGGLRLESSSTESLVVKLSGDDAGFVASGQQLDIDDRVGGALHIIGQPTKPVILTSLTDFSAGAGFTPEGQPQVNTENADLSVFDPIDPTTLPTIGEIDRGTNIDNDVLNDIPGSFGVNPSAGGALGEFGPTVTDINDNALFGDNRATLDGSASGTIIDQDFIFDFFNYIDIGGNGSAIELGTTTITTPPTLVAPDTVVSQGTVAGNNGQTINWQVETSIASGETRLTNQLTFSSAQPFGDVRFINYLDEDLNFVSDDFLNTAGTPGAEDFRVYTLDGPERVGFAQGGVYTPGADLVNASYDGWAADQYDDLQLAITGAGTTYSVAGNIDTVDLPPFTDPTLGASFGPADITTAFAWSLDPNATTATVTTFLELLPQDPAGIEPDLGTPGDWSGVVLEAFSHDRNVDITNEQEPQDAIVGSNGSISSAQFLGELAPRETASDENLRLGFQVNGTLSSVNDSDFYRFEAAAGTAVVIDIDRTTHALDTVVELLAADGTVLARSDDSTAEINDPDLITTAPFVLDSTVAPLRISDFSDPDRFTTNPRDAGFTIKLPGAAGTTGPYFLRVSSGGSAGVYQMQVRLDTVDEFPGSTIRHADIRFATNGVSVLGQPIHSPLTGEAAENSIASTPAGSITLGNVQNLGNVLESDRSVISVAGGLADSADVDVFEFTINYEDVSPDAVGGLVPIVIDVDYADGLGRANTIVSLFDANGGLLASSRDANIGGDQPRAGQGTDLADLSRGSVGALDPFLGPISLSVGNYFVGISSDSQIPTDYRQFVDPNASNPLARLEPTISVERIVDEHLDGFLGTASNPVVPNFLGAQSVVPHFLNDVVLYVSHNSELVDNTELSAVNPFTGAIYTNLGNIGREVADIDFRNDDTLVALTKDLKDLPDNNTFDDDDTGNYIQIDHTGAANPLSTLIGDDGIQTFELDVAAPPASIRSHLFNGTRIGDGIHFEAIEVGTFNNVGETGFGVGNRPCEDINSITLLCSSTDEYHQPPGIPFNYNVLYQFNPQTGEAFSSPAADRTGTALATEAGTQIVERGFLNTGAAFGAGNNFKLVVTEEPTVTNPATVNVINDEAVTFSVDNAIGPDTLFQLVSGPEIRLQMQPATVGATDVPFIFMDGWTFELDTNASDALPGQTFEIDTGEVLVVEGGGTAFSDGESFTLTDIDGDSKTFEFDIQNPPSLTNPNAFGIPFNSAMSDQQMAQAIADAINSPDPEVSGFRFSAELIATANPNFYGRISLIDTLTASEASAALTISGQAGSNMGNPTLPIEETSNNLDFVTSVLATFANVVNIEASAEGNRVNFPGVDTGDFQGIIDGAAAAGVGSPIVDLGNDGFVSIPGAIPVPFGVGDAIAHDPTDPNPPRIGLANRIVDAINDSFVLNVGDPLAAGLDSSGNVELLLGNLFTSADDPLETAGDAPGGTVTGVAIADVNGVDTLFAVSDEGGLYRIDNATTPRAATAVYLQSSIELRGIQFTGLTNGPQNVENGRYADMLFATDADGLLYAFNYRGELQPVFVGGNTSVATGLSAGNGSANGLVFSSLDRNLWSLTDRRAGDAGTGIETVDDRPGAPNLATLHFGTTTDYDFPGGAYGAVESATFSLAGYSAADQPVLYFNYYLDTENTNSFVAMRDAFNVYINDGTDNWVLLADNNDPTAAGGASNLYDVGDANAPDSWRQARVDLAQFAGLDNLQLRFEFHTGANFEFGEARIGGYDLRALPGAELRDGDIFTIDGVDFELEFGPTLLAPTGTNVEDGDTFTIHNVTFEFDANNDGVTTNNAVEIDVSNDLSPDALALVMADAIANARFVYEADLLEGAIPGDTNDVLGDAVLTGLPGGGDRFESSGIIGDNLGGIDVDMLELQLNIGDQLDVNIFSPGPDILNPAIKIFDENGVAFDLNGFDPGDAFVGNNVSFTAPTTGAYFVGISGEGNEDYTADGLNNSNGDVGTYDLTLVVNGFTGIIPRVVENRIQLDGAAFGKFLPETSTVELDGEDGVAIGNVEVELNSDMTATDVAVVIQQAVADTFANGITETVYRYGNVVKIIGFDLTDTGPLPGITGSLPGHNLAADSSVTPTAPNGNVPAELRFRDNAHEGVYIDDIIIGFAERGEVGTNRGPFGYGPNPLAAGGQILTGEYQVEIRLGADIAGTTFDTNHRFEGQAATLVAPGSSELIDGQTFAISDGIGTAIFEFNDVNILPGEPGFGVAQGRTPIDFDPSAPPVPTTNPPRRDNEPNFVIAQTILEAINGPDVQSQINVLAALSDGTTDINPFLTPEENSTDWRINLFGDFVDIKPAVPVDLPLDLSQGATEFQDGNDQIVPDTPGTGTDAGATASGNAAGISASVFTTSDPALRGAIGDNPNKLGNDAPLDVDLVRVSLASGDVVSIDVDAAEIGSSLDSYIRVFDLTGVELTSNYAGRSPDDEIASTDSYLEFIAPSSGIYYIGISGASQAVDTNGDLVFDIFGNPVLGGGNTNYDATDSPSGTASGATTGAYDLTIDILSGGIEVIRFDNTEIGDSNVTRDQGQLIIENTIVSESEEFGINIGAADRTGPNSDVSHQGPVRNLRELNSQLLVPGAVVVNNVLANNVLGGIRFAGDDQGGASRGPVPVGRIYNNTLVGDGGAISGSNNDIGILVENNASPTLLNNLIVNFDVGIDVATDSSSTVIGGTLYQGNNSPISGTTPSMGESAIDTPVSQQLFVDFSNGIYYLNPGVGAIDSSINALDDRNALTTVKQPLGIADSPLLAPARDALGQLRVDDLTGGVPGSTGDNLFVDRGAIERADNAGPTALLINPRDNDASGLDDDPTISIVELPLDTVLSHFTIQLLDGVEPADPAGGIGVNDQAVSPDQITILRDDVPLVEGVDYNFGYDAVNDVIRLTPTAGIWAPNHVYRVVMANGDQFVITAPDGTAPVDGDTFTVTDKDSNVVNFEYDSGYVLEVTETLTLRVPSQGGALGGVVDREGFLVTNNGTGQTFVFEFDNNGAASGGTIPIVFTPVMTDDEIAQAIVDAINGADTGLQPKLIGDGQVHLGASPDHVVDIALAPSLALSGSATTGGVLEGNLLVVDDGSTRFIYEFDIDGAVGIDVNGNPNSALPFTYGQTHLEIAQLITARIAADTTLTPQNLADGRLHLGGTRVTFMDSAASNLLLTGTPGVTSDFGIRIPSEAGAVVNVTDGNTFQVGDGIALPVTFEFDNDGFFVPGNTIISFNDQTTLDVLTNAVASAIAAVGIGLSPSNLGGGFISLGNSNVNHVFNPLFSSLVQTGSPGVPGNVAIPYVPDASFTVTDMAAAITNAINGSNLNSEAVQRGGDVLASNIQTITGIVDAFVESVQDYAGNVLQPNQGDGSTQFTIIFGEGQDFGDALSLPTLEQFDGARHTVVDGFSLGVDVDVDPDGLPTANADGDDNSSRDDEDGVTHDGFVPGFTTTLTVEAQGISAERPGFLDAWIDFDKDGTLEPSEKVADSLPLVNGNNQIALDIPIGVSPGDAVARFRFSSTGGLEVSGAAADGEVEDYVFSITSSSWTNPSNRYDVVPDSVVTPFDLLKMLQFVQNVGTAPVPKDGNIEVPVNGGMFVFEPPPVSPFYDVNQDRVISITDLRELFSHLIGLDSGTGEGEAEGEGGSARSIALGGELTAAMTPVAPLNTVLRPTAEPVVREVEFLLAPPPEALIDVDADTNALLEDTLPLDEAIRDVADDVVSTFSQNEDEVDDFFAQLGEE